MCAADEKPEDRVFTVMCDCAGVDPLLNTVLSTAAGFALQNLPGSIYDVEILGVYVAGISGTYQVGHLALAAVNHSELVTGTPCRSVASRPKDDNSGCPVAFSGATLVRVPTYVAPVVGLQAAGNFIVYSPNFVPIPPLTLPPGYVATLHALAAGAATAPKAVLGFRYRLRPVR